MNEEDEAFEELALKQGQWEHTSGWRKKQIMEKMEQAFPNPHRTDMTGMTLRQYAAIKLKVPDSGTDWLDDMIRQSLRDDFALQGICERKPGSLMTSARIATEAYILANAMMKERNSIWHNATPKEREA